LIVVRADLKPTIGAVYFTLTNNSKRKPEEVDKATVEAYEANRVGCSRGS
jgi:secreted PhoX family phosphatase